MCYQALLFRATVLTVLCKYHTDNLETICLVLERPTSQHICTTLYSTMFDSYQLVDYSLRPNSMLNRVLVAICSRENRKIMSGRGRLWPSCLPTRWTPGKHLLPRLQTQQHHGGYQETYAPLQYLKLSLSKKKSF